MAEEAEVKRISPITVTLLAVVLAGVGVNANAANSLTLSDGVTNYTCTLDSSSLSIAAGGTAVTANVTGCTPALGGGGGTPVTTPVGPVTVAAQSTTNTTPTVTGTATLGTDESLRVTLNGVTYTVGGNQSGGTLTLTGTNWALAISSPLSVATYPVTAQIVHTSGGVLSDSTTNELVITSSGSGGGSPAYGTGSWLPNGNNSLVVVDQSGLDGAGGATIIPGCVNGGSAAYGAACRNVYTYTDPNNTSITTSLTAGKVLSVRYRPVANAATGSSTGYFQLANVSGGNIVYSTTMSLSTTPGDFDANSVGASCKFGPDTRRPTLFTGSGYCNIDRSKPYYLNIKVETTCTSCVFTINENSSELY